MMSLYLIITHEFVKMFHKFRSMVHFGQIISVLLSILLFKTCRPMSNSTGGTENPSVRPKSHVKSASLTQSQVARVTDLPPLNDGDNFRPT